MYTHDFRRDDYSVMFSVPSNVRSTDIMFELIVSWKKISNGIEGRCLGEEGVSEYIDTGLRTDLRDGRSNSSKMINQSESQKRNPVLQSRGKIPTRMALLNAN